MDENQQQNCPVCGNNCFCLMPEDYDFEVSMIPVLKFKNKTDDAICTRCASMFNLSEKGQIRKQNDFSTDYFKELKITLKEVTGKWITGWSTIEGKRIESLARNHPDMIRGESVLFQTLAIPQSLKNYLSFDLYLRKDSFIFNGHYFYFPIDPEDCRLIEEHHEEIAKKGLCVFKSYALGILIAYNPLESCR